MPIPRKKEGYCNQCKKTKLDLKYNKYYPHGEMGYVCFYCRVKNRKRQYAQIMSNKRGISTKIDVGYY